MSGLRCALYAAVQNEGGTAPTHLALPVLTQQACTAASMSRLRCAFCTAVQKAGGNPSALACFETTGLQRYAHVKPQMCFLCCCVG